MKEGVFIYNFYLNIAFLKCVGTYLSKYFKCLFLFVYDILLDKSGAISLVLGVVFHYLTWAPFIGTHIFYLIILTNI